MNRPRIESHPFAEPSSFTSRSPRRAAKTSFSKRCEADARASCDSSAEEKKRSGAAQTHFAKKCVADAEGN